MEVGLERVLSTILQNSAEMKCILAHCFLTAAAGSYAVRV